MRTEASQSLTFKMVSMNVFKVTMAIAIVLCLCDVQCQQLQRGEQDEWKLTEDIENLPKQRFINFDWLKGLSVNANYDQGRLGGALQYNRGNFQMQATGSVNLGGLLTGNLDPQGGISASWLKKRGVPLVGPNEYFKLRIEVNPCQFNVYDRNGDGMITLEDLYNLFPSHRLADRLFLDLKTGLEGDVDAIDERYFSFMAPQLILGCQPPSKNHDDNEI